MREEHANDKNQNKFNRTLIRSLILTHTHDFPFIIINRCCWRERRFKMIFNALVKMKNGPSSSNDNTPSFSKPKINWFFSLYKKKKVVGPRGLIDIHLQKQTKKNRIWLTHNNNNSNNIQSVEGDETFDITRVTTTHTHTQ